MNCDYRYCCWEEIIPLSLWRKLLKKARELDINDGGLWDARSAAICLWCSPEDKPESWKNVEIDKGMLRYPRSFLAVFYGEYVGLVGDLSDDGLSYRDGLIRVHLVIAPYDKMRQIFGVEWGIAEKYASEDEKEWCLRKWEELKRSVELESELELEW